MRKYEWRDTQHGPQLWNTEKECWALWYGIQAIGIDDYTKAEIQAALNPCWGAADEYIAAMRDEITSLKQEKEGILQDLCDEQAAYEEARREIDDMGKSLAYLRRTSTEKLQLLRAAGERLARVAKCYVSDYGGEEADLAVAHWREVAK